MRGMGQAIYESGVAQGLVRGIILSERARGASDEEFVETLITLAQFTRKQARKRFAEENARKAMVAS